MNQSMGDAAMRGDVSGDEPGRTSMNRSRSSHVACMPCACRSRLALSISVRSRCQLQPQHGNISAPQKGPAPRRHLLQKDHLDFFAPPRQPTKAFNDLRIAVTQTSMPSLFSAREWSQPLGVGLVEVSNLHQGSRGQNPTASWKA